MNTDTCVVCGCTELNLIDGFYYCTECNTQNTAVRETIVEQKTLGDGTFALSTKKKIVKIPKKTVRMSYEWYKWHATNFIINGLADELIAVGAQPSFKTKLLWIWTRYIKKYQDRKQMDQIQEVLVDDTTKEDKEDCASEIESEDEGTRKKSTKEVIIDGSWRDVKHLSKSIIMAMLYLALNFDNSNIQLSHIYRFIREQRLTFTRLSRFVPEEILEHLKPVPQWKCIVNGLLIEPPGVRAYALSLLRVLDLGTPVVPDLRIILDNYLNELCLPNDLKPLVHSLMHFSPCDFLDLDDKAKSFLTHLPDYECIVMSYVLLAVKLCFGLDCDYDGRLSDVVERINEERGLPKSHKYGKYSDPTDRLFSFREWCSYRQYIKIMLCKYCLFMAEQHSLDTDDTVLMEHMADRPQHKKLLTDEIAMDLIKRIVVDDNVTVIPRDDFVPTLTPISLYTEIIIDHCQDPEVKALLSEDFKQYTLKYAWENLELIDLDTSENVITGVSETRKVTTNKFVLGKLVVKSRCKKNYVYVRNCENSNWMNTKPPTLEHVVHSQSRSSAERTDKDSDHGYDSGSTLIEREVLNYQDHDQENAVKQELSQDSEILETITEEDEDRNIFDDSFEYLDEDKEEEPPVAVDTGEDIVEPVQQPNNDYSDNESDISCISFHNYNPATFDRDQTIKELVLLACKKYKISKPREYKVKPPRPVPKKRKIIDLVNGETDTPEQFKRRIRGDTAEAKKRVGELISNYYEHVGGDFFNKLQQQVNMAIQNAQAADEANQTENNLEQTNVTNEPDGDVDNTADNQMDVDLNMSQVDETQQSVNENLESQANLEASLFEGDKMNLINVLPESDPQFDAKLYDVSQLYVKINDETTEQENPAEEQEPELEKIVARKILESKDEAVFENLTKLKAEQSDSEDDIPLSTLIEERDLIMKKYSQEENFDSLVKKENIQRLNYWCRHYVSYYMDKRRDRQKKFEEELRANTPATFFFFIRECASILDCSVFYLYRRLQHLEEILIIKSK